MTKLIKIASPAEVAVDVIFVHGLDGDAIQTWGKDGSSNWLDWLATDVAGVQVWTLDYDAASSKLRGASMRLEDRAVNVLEALSLEDLGARPICFVAHSLGGLLVKEVILESRGASGRKAELSAAVAGVVFLSTPHSGSALASIAKTLVPYFSSNAIFDLGLDDAHLRRMGTHYRDWADSSSAAHVVLYENRDTRHVRVVTPSSADPGLSRVTPIPVDQDHVSIAKPASRDDLVYKSILRLVRDTRSSMDRQPTEAALHHDPDAIPNNSPPTDPVATSESATTPTGTTTSPRISSQTPYFLMRRAVSDQLLPLEAGRASLVALSGPPGIGKTTLVTQWASSHSDRFPGAQLYVNMNGYGPGPRIDLSELTRILLTALGAPPTAIPEGDEERLAVCRTQLSGAGNLLVLDNVESAVQVARLLSPFPPCATLVTSRDTLEPLVLSGALAVKVPPFNESESSEYLENRLGTSWLRADRASVDLVIETCSGVPLALGLVGARASMDALTSTDVATQLTSAEGALDFLDLGDDRSGIAAVYSWSLSKLSMLARSAFAFIGLLRSRRFRRDLIRAGLRLTDREAQQSLLELRRASLVDAQNSSLFSAHDLTLQVAASSAYKWLSEAECDRAWSGAVRFLASAAYAADRVLYPKRSEIPLPVSKETDLGALTYSKAFEWFRESLAAALAVLDNAPRPANTHELWQLSWGLTTYLDRSGSWEDYARSQRAGVELARSLNDAQLIAISQRLLATALTRTGHHDEARERLSESLILSDSQSEAARTTLALAFVDGAQGEFAPALNLASQAFEIYNEEDDEVGAARALSFVVAYRTQVDPHHPASPADIRRAIGTLRSLSNTWELGHALHHEGALHRALGNLGEAVESFAESAEIFRTTEDPYLEARAWTAAGDSAAERNDHVTAYRYWSRARGLLAPFGPAFTAGFSERFADSKETVSEPLPTPHPMP
ncbi:NB-ARC domain-containing protein [Microbacterium aurum]|uniref:NB-ARC domain-containing protein n=1 Tax=Microbacterium aurum TaxID=36805 RepID=UPI001EF70ECD|nr:NB-ARC domain-containing protein [Microbacterium aurum]MCG7414651.1 NB-ARC domain-containing protein [Microbacterium aurum]